MTKIAGMREFADLVEAERRRQIDKWGDQRHPDGTGRTVDVHLRDDAIHETRSAADRGRVTWALIFKEEVLEACAERDEDMLVIELIQAAAVIQAWISDIKSRRDT
jgi:hypothetical protein